VIVLLSATEAALKLQVVSNGMAEHNDAESAMVPLKPFIAVNVSIVEPLPPGLLMATVVGLAVTLKVGAGVTTSAVEAVEAA
jgi:hypothetical protein